MVDFFACGRDLLLEPARLATIGEPGLAQKLKKVVRAGRLRADCSYRALKDRTAVFVCVDTPPTQSGDADLSRVWNVIDHLPELSGRAILVMKSTVPVGTGEKIRHGLEERDRGGRGRVPHPGAPLRLRLRRPRPPGSRRADLDQPGRDPGQRH